MTYSLILAICALVQAEPGNIDLTGKVTSAEGEPIAQATVFVYTAKPRVGFPVVDPFCYADCQKKTATDASGKFVITALDPGLVFKVLVVAEGYQPKFAPDVDPHKSPLDVELNLKPKLLAGYAVLRGQVVDAQGKPVAGAVVTPFGFSKSRIDQNAEGSRPGFDVTNARGEFLIIGNKGYLGFILQVEGRGFAEIIVDRLPTGDTMHTITLTEGTTVTGRIVSEGKPVAGIVVGLLPLSSGRSGFGTTDERNGRKIATDRDGRFTFANVQANSICYLSTLMRGTEKPGGAIQTEVVTVSGDGTVKDLGDLGLKPTHQITGRLILTDGKLVPASTKINLGREYTRDGQFGIVGEDGSFHFEGVPEGGIHLYMESPVTAWPLNAIDCNRRMQAG